MARERYETQTRFTLTERQQSVLDLVAAGKTNREIAEALSITLDGAKWHVSEILRKLNVESREDAVAAWRRGDVARRPFNRVATLIWRSAMVAAGTGAALLAGIVVFHAAASHEPSFEAAFEVAPPAASIIRQPAAVPVARTVDTNHDLRFVVDAVDYPSPGEAVVSYHLEGDTNGLSFLSGEPGDPAMVRVEDGVAANVPLTTRMAASSGTTIRFPSATVRGPVIWS